ncbi:unnamed protein product [Gongylonema pulchrum]|uniref:SAC domain-containing protein n=1 Tax=Gongylonema pulchrum TaxID=637853 RepID=A0A183DT00_9BILA|nr:unnamed protein product [Gongylonema pulchrum]
MRRGVDDAFGHVSPFIMLQKVSAGRLIWILKLRRPVRRLVTEYDLSSFMHEFDDAVVAYFDSEVAFSISYDFRQYIKAALNVFQHQNLLETVGFAVVTNSTLAATVSPIPKTWIQMKAWDRIVNYHHNLTDAEIYEWVRDEAARQNGLRWISPELNGVAKSEDLLSILQDNATVLIFMDRQVLYPHSWVGAVVEQSSY